MRPRLALAFEVASVAWGVFRCLMQTNDEDLLAFLQAWPNVGATEGQPPGA